MNIDDYPIYYPYNATSPPYSPGQPHKGNDYALQESDPVIIEGTQIGKTGHTGWADGPHVHVQAGRDEWAQNPINPTSYVGKPGIAVKTGFGSQWGNYVCVRVGDVNVFYCHLSRIDVNVGDIIGGDMATDQQKTAWINYEHENVFGKPAPQPVIDSWRGILNKDYVQGSLDIMASNNKNPAALKNKPANGNAPVGTYLKVDKSDILEVK